jgi:Uma2 family endonuclease
MSVQRKTGYTLEQYLELESSTRVKHEYFRGEVFAMGGASFAHTVIAGNVVSALHGQLRGRPCRVSASDLRVKVDRTGLYTYPDVVVVCGAPQLEQPGDTLLNPGVIVEVISESTEAYDRGKKFEQYRSLDSLTDYILIAQDTVRAEHYSRQPDNRWLYAAENRVEGSIMLVSIGCALALAEVYEKVDGLREPTSAPYS